MNSNEAGPANARDDASKRAEDERDRGAVTGKGPAKGDEPSTGDSESDETQAADDRSAIDLDLAHDRAS